MSDSKKNPASKFIKALWNDVTGVALPPRPAFYALEFLHEQIKSRHFQNYVKAMVSMKHLVGEKPYLEEAALRAGMIPGSKQHTLWMRILKNLKEKPELAEAFEKCYKVQTPTLDNLQKLLDSPTPELLANEAERLANATGLVTKLKNLPSPEKYIEKLSSHKDCLQLVKIINEIYDLDSELCNHTVIDMILAAKDAQKLMSDLLRPLLYQISRWGSNFNNPTVFSALIRAIPSDREDAKAIPMYVSKTTEFFKSIIKFDDGVMITAEMLERLILANKGYQLLDIMRDFQVPERLKKALLTSRNPEKFGSILSKLSPVSMRSLNKANFDDYDILLGYDSADVINMLSESPYYSIDSETRYGRWFILMQELAAHKGAQERITDEWVTVLFKYSKISIEDFCKIPSEELTSDLASALYRCGDAEASTADLKTLSTSKAHQQKIIETFARLSTRRIFSISDFLALPADKMTPKFLQTLKLLGEASAYQPPDIFSTEALKRLLESVPHQLALLTNARYWQVYGMFTKDSLSFSTFMEISALNLNMSEHMIMLAQPYWANDAINRGILTLTTFFKLSEKDLSKFHRLWFESNDKCRRALLEHIKQLDDRSPKPVIPRTVAEREEPGASSPKEAKLSSAGSFPFFSGTSHSTSYEEPAQSSPTLSIPAGQDTELTTNSSKAGIS